ncbi:MAG: aminoacyl-tRNA hydrolase [Cytophagaceae bacterium]|nr:aminoacyl-tRNA hydrolase [Cytophagaceae bacterium]
MNRDLLISECNFSAVRSSGPGGQNVNKTSTKVILSWDVASSQAFDEEQKGRLREKLSNKITKEDILIINDSQSRSQHKNKENVIARFFLLLEYALQKPKPRKKTKVPRAVKRKRLEAKKQHAEKKANRKPPKL